MTMTIFGLSWDAGYEAACFGQPYNNAGYDARMYDEGYQFGLRKAAA